LIGIFPKLGNDLFLDRQHGVMEFPFSGQFPILRGLQGHVCVKIGLQLGGSDAFGLIFPTVDDIFLCWIAILPTSPIIFVSSLAILFASLVIFLTSLSILLTLPAILFTKLAIFLYCGYCGANSCLTLFMASLNSAWDAVQKLYPKMEYSIVL
jgi:hypothetical protein